MSGRRRRQRQATTTATTTPSSSSSSLLSSSSSRRTVNTRNSRRKSTAKKQAGGSLTIPRKKKATPVPWASLALVQGSSSVLGVVVAPGERQEALVEALRKSQSGGPTIIKYRSGKADVGKVSFARATIRNRKRKRDGIVDEAEEERRKKIDEANEKVVETAKANLADWLAKLKANPRSWKLGPDDNWCRYCGASKASSFGASPWGSRKLCTPHYVKIMQKKHIRLTTAQTSSEPKRPLKPEANTEFMYQARMQIKANNRALEAILTKEHSESESDEASDIDNENKPVEGDRTSKGSSAKEQLSARDRRYAARKADAPS